MAYATDTKETQMLIVINTESGDNEILGEYVRTEEDAVGYLREEDGALDWAPEDCVRLASGTRCAPGYPLHEVPGPPSMQDIADMAGRPMMSVGGPNDGQIFYPTHPRD